MNKAVVIEAFGGPEVMRFVERDPGAPGAGEILLKHEAIGLNFIDVYHRTGLYPNPLPFTPGSEGAGVVEAVGAGVSNVKPGDRVCYSGPLGAYAERRLLPASEAIPVPQDISSEVAAAILVKALTVNYLLTMTWPLKAGESILFHAAAGGVGSLAAQWAKSIGARVIGTVGSAAKVEVARDNGCDHVINTTEEDFVARVREITGGKGVDVVYDSIGKDTFARSLDCLRPLGLMVSFGNASGPVSVPNLGILASKGSLFLTRPTLAPYYAAPGSKQKAAARIFGMIADGTLRLHIGQRFNLSDAADAHRALEGRNTTGSTVLLP